MFNETDPKKIEKAKKLIANGETVKNAAAAIGVHYSTIYSHLKKTKRAKTGKKFKVSKVISIPETTNVDRIVMFVGTPDAVAAAARSMM